MREAVGGSAEVLLDIEVLGIGAEVDGLAAAENAPYDPIVFVVDQESTALRLLYSSMR
jgi:hypothetical protein